jgi:hypothetical protein
MPFGFILPQGWIIILSNLSILMKVVPEMRTKFDIYIFIICILLLFPIL